MSLLLHAAVSSPLARQLLGSTALIAGLAAVLFATGEVNADWFFAAVFLAVVSGIASIALGAASVVLRWIAAIREWGRP